MRRILGFSAASFVVLALAACSENPNAVKQAPSAASLTITPGISLDEGVGQILSLFPTGLETAATTRWANVKAKYAAGLKDPAQMVVAKQLLVELSDWIVKKSPGMVAPPNNESRSAASSRAVLYMAMYVYNGPATPAPVYTPTADAVTGIVTPGAPATIVTPTLHAGVQLEAGSVSENTIIVVRQNPTPYPANCSGPLQTRLCQYPQFYFFDAFPDKVLLKPAKFAVCHVNAGDTRRPLADHDRFRLAHTKPANPADYTPGSTIRDQNGENIEILPLVAQTFSTCEDNAYTIQSVGSAPIKMLSRFASSLKSIVTPKRAYAIDIGLGGISKKMSPFNDVDPLGQPDLAVESFTATAPSVTSGSSLPVTFAIRNVGTATPDTIHAAVLLTPATTLEGEPVSRRLLTVKTLPLAPLGLTSASDVAVTIPADVPAGAYRLTFTIDDNPVFPDANANNNAASLDLSVTSAITDLGTLPGDNAAVAMSINESGHVVGYSFLRTSSDARVFLWVNGEMTSLGVLSVDGAPLVINDNDDVAGSSRDANGNYFAFRWRSGTVTNLGSLPGYVSTMPTGINKNGDIVGVGTQANGEWHGWIWRNGVMTDLGLPPGQTFCYPTAINDAGVVTGYSNFAAWTWQNGVFTSLPTSTNGATPLAINAAGLIVGSAFGTTDHAVQWVNRELLDLPGLAGDSHSQAEAVSSDGRIVGYSYPDVPRGQFILHPVLWQGGSVVNLGSLDGVFAEAISVNSAGQIVGQSSGLDNTVHAVMWHAPTLP